MVVTAVDFTIEVDVIASTTTSFDSDSILCMSPFYTTCDWANWLIEPDDVRAFENALRIDGYRKELFTKKVIPFAQVSSPKEFKKYIYKLKIKHRDWMNKQSNG